jgi:hypothetical protein
VHFHYLLCAFSTFPTFCHSLSVLHVFLYTVLLCQSIKLNIGFIFCFVPDLARYKGIVVDDVPRQLSLDLSSTHSIYFPKEQVRLPLELKGIILYLPTHYPSDHELNNCTWLTVTYELPWDPYSDDFAVEEENFVNFNDYTFMKQNQRDIMSISTTHSIHSQISAINSDTSKLSISDERIANIFQCSPRVATNTRKVTTQKCIKSITDHLT